MLILESEQVQYCQVVANIEGQLKTESGLIYQNNVFIKEKTYSKEDLPIAIKECREDYLDNENIEVPLLIIKEENKVTLWLEDNRFKPEQGNSPSLSPQEELKSSAQVKVKSSEKINIKELIAKMRGEDGVEIKTRRYQLKLYKRCFVGSEAVDLLVNHLKISRTKAVAIGKKLVHKKVIHHVTDEHSFKDANLFYRFYEDEEKSIWTDKLL
ncbi:MAG: DEP domain-containing protein [Xenococcaceae cyanobacterium]